MIRTLQFKMFSKKWCTLLVVAAFHISLTLSAPAGENESTTYSSEKSVLPTSTAKAESPPGHSTEKLEITTVKNIDEDGTTTQSLEDEIGKVTEIPTKEPEVTTETVDDTTTEAAEKPIGSTATLAVNNVAITKTKGSEVDSTTHSEDEIGKVTEIPTKKPEVTTETVDETTTEAAEKPIESTTAPVNDHKFVTTQSALQHNITKPTSDINVHSTTEINNENVSTTKIIPDESTTIPMIDDISNTSTTQASETKNSSMLDSILKKSGIPDVISSVKDNLPQSNAATFSQIFNFYLIIPGTLLTYITFLNH